MTHQNTSAAGRGRSRRMFAVLGRNGDGSISCVSYTANGARLEFVDRYARYLVKKDEPASWAVALKHGYRVRPVIVTIEARHD